VGDTKGLDNSLLITSNKLSAAKQIDGGGGKKKVASRYGDHLLYLSNCVLRLITTSPNPRGMMASMIRKKKTTNVTFPKLSC
jgi:hypothetical protein